MQEAEKKIKRQKKKLFKPENGTRRKKTDRILEKKNVGKGTGTTDTNITNIIQEI